MPVPGRRPLGATFTCVVILVLSACTSSESTANDDSLPTTSDTTASATTDTTTTTTAAAPAGSESLEIEDADEEPRADEETTTTVLAACGAIVNVAFNESAPRDRMTIENASTSEISVAAIEFDLTSSAGDIILDTTPGGEGVEVYQDFAIEDGNAVLAIEPVAEDGGSSLRLDFESFNPGESFTFSIDVDDRLADSDLGQIQVTGAEMEGASIVIETQAAGTFSTTFNNESTATYDSGC